MEEEYDIFFEMDACVSDTSEWDMWDVIRFLYDPIAIPKPIQLSVYQRVSTLTSPLIFNSFHFHPLIRQFSDQHSAIVDPTFELYRDRIHTNVVQMIFQLYPNYIQSVNANPDVIFFSYDQKLERFVLFTTNMGIARGVHYWIETEVQYVLPFVFLWEVSQYLSLHADTLIEMKTADPTSIPRHSMCEWMIQLWDTITQYLYQTHTKDSQRPAI